MVSLQTEASPLHPFRLRIAVHGPPGPSTMGIRQTCAGGAQTSARPKLELLWLLTAWRPPAGQAGSAGGHGAR